MKSSYRSYNRRHLVAYRHPVAQIYSCDCRCQISGSGLVTRKMRENLRMPLYAADFLCVGTLYGGCVWDASACPGDLFLG